MLEILLKQHEGILKALEQIEGMLAKNVSAQSFELLMEVSKLAGKVKVHLAQEDRGLYPLLYKHKNPQVREIASLFNQEMGSLFDDFNNFRAMFTTANSLKENPTRFVDEMKAIAKKLRQRMAAEGESLYPLLTSKG